MNYLLIVFASRRDAVSFAEKLQYNNAPFEIINTPRRLSLSCGISVKTSERSVNTVRRILNSYRFSSYSGMYIYKNSNYYPYR